jgi:hypothetical protein
LCWLHGQACLSSLGPGYIGRNSRFGLDNTEFLIKKKKNL